MPTLNAATQGLSWVVGGVVNVAEHFPVATTAIMGITTGLIGMRVGAIASGYAWTFIKGGWLSALTAVKSLPAGVALANTKLAAFNATALITAVRTKALAVGGAIKGFAGALVALATKTIPVVIGAIKGLTTALMTNPVGLIIGGIAVAAGLIITHWEPISEFFSGVWASVKTAFTDGDSLIRRVLSWSPLGIVIEHREPISRFLRFSGKGL
ncbi:MAG: hypothetical protein GKR94_27920 [Gammaproteobacteria bacterium]|nr:hypothetical protein [Gammaproteobacteria bacterium]